MTDTEMLDALQRAKAIASIKPLPYESLERVGQRFVEVMCAITEIQVELTQRMLVRELKQSDETPL